MLRFEGDFEGKTADLSVQDPWRRFWQRRLKSTLQWTNECGGARPCRQHRLQRTASQMHWKCEAVRRERSLHGCVAVDCFPMLQGHADHD